MVLSLAVCFNSRSVPRLRFINSWLILYVLNGQVENQKGQSKNRSASMLLVQTSWSLYNNKIQCIHLLWTCILMGVKPNVWINKLLNSKNYISVAYESFEWCTETIMFMAAPQKNYIWIRLQTFSYMTIVLYIW